MWERGYCNNRTAILIMSKSVVKQINKIYIAKGLRLHFKKNNEINFVDGSYDFSELQSQNNDILSPGLHIL